MSARFPQSATSVAYRIKAAYSSKVLAIYWAATADSVHRLYSSDVASTVITRSASGAGFDGANGRITGNNRGSGGVYFSDSKTGGFGTTEDGNLTYIAGYYGDLFNGVGDPWIMGCATPMDAFNNKQAIKGANYNLDYVRSGSSIGSHNAGGGDDVAAYMTFGLRHVPSDPTARYRVWANGAEVVGLRSTSTPSSTSVVGDASNPLRFGGTSAGTGNTSFQGEVWIVATNLSDAEMDAITADPSIIVEAYTAPAPTISVQPTGQSVTAPAPAGFTASVSGSYTGLRWQRQAAGAGGWSDVVGGTGGTTTSFTTGATSVSGGSYNNTDKIRLAVDWLSGTVLSDEVTLTVTAGGTAPGFSVQPTNESSTVGSTATFDFTVTGSGSLTVQAKKNGSNVGSPFAVTAGVPASYTTPSLLIGDNGAVYTFVATGDTSPTATSSDATLTVLQPLATTFSFTLNGGNSLTGLKYAVFDQVTPDLWAAPIKQAANGSSNGSGVVTIDVTGLTARRIGEKGSAILTNSDGTDTGGSQAATRKLAYYVGAFS